MRIRVTIVSILIFALPNISMADCIDLIRAAKTSSITIRSSGDIESAASAFCSDYSQAKSNGKSGSAGASYGLFSGSVSGSTSSAEELASKYCSSSNMSKAKETAYQSYVESIAPEAYPSYVACEAGTSPLIASLDQQAILPLSLTITVRNTGSQHAKEGVQFVASPDASCGWEDPFGPVGEQIVIEGKTVTLPGASSAILKCTRDTPNDDSAITLAFNSSGDPGYTFRWKSFVGNIQTDALEEIRNSNLSLLHSMMGAIVAFEGECPAGWLPNESLAGKVIVGAGAGKLVVGDGTSVDLSIRQVGDTGGEERVVLSVDEMPAHTHSTTAAGHWGDKGLPDGNAGWGIDDGVSASQPLDTSSTGSNLSHENMPPYAVMQFCSLQFSAFAAEK